MIKNVVFDVSGVLLKLNFWGCLDIFNWSPEVKKQISEIIFESEQGKKFFNGKIGTLTFYKTLLKQYPNHKEELKQVFYPEFLSRIMPPNYETFEFLKELKSDYNIYILSNMDKHMSKYFKNLFEIDEHINGAVYSFEVNHKKPDREIFEALLEKYNINPSETIYIDDSKRNIETADSLGFKTFLFKSAEKTIPQIKDYLKKDFKSEIAKDFKPEIESENCK